MAKKGEGKGAPPAKSPAKVPAASPTKVSAAYPARKVPVAAVEELPGATVRRLVKDKLWQLSAGGKGGEKEVPVHKDALLAFAESARVFIHYLSATANDVCVDSTRQTINAEDVLKAVKDIDFPEFIEPLKLSLEEFRRKNNVKKSRVKAKEAVKKRKFEDERNGEHREDDAQEEQMEYVGGADGDDE